MKNQKTKISVLFALIGVLVLAVALGFTSQINFASASVTSDNVAVDFLEINNNGWTGNTWSITVSNPNDYSVQLFYNKKMCFFGDAQNWEALNDIAQLYLAANSSITVQIQENAFATSVAFSFVKNEKRWITYGDSLNTDGNINVYYSAVDYLSNCLGLAIDGKTDKTWRIRVTNNNDYSINLHYNKKMCHEGDAKSWNLSNDVNTDYTIDSHSSRVIYITENWFAKCIAVSYVNGSTRYITYAYNLDNETKLMTIRTVPKPIKNA